MLPLLQDVKPCLAAIEAANLQSIFKLAIDTLKKMKLSCIKIITAWNTITNFKEIEDLYWSLVKHRLV